MERYLITSPKFSGTIELVYSDTGKLARLDFTQAALDLAQVEWVKQRTPVLVSGANLTQAFGPINAIIVSADFIVTFEEYWTKYNKKINKKRCMPIWERLNKAKQVQAFYGIEKYEKFLKTTTRQKLDPENYLRNEAWENEWR